MIHIVHGENSSASRRFVTDLIKKDSRVKVDLDIFTATPADLSDSLVSADMFGVKRTVFFDISKSANKNLDVYLKALKHINEQTDLVVFSEKALTKTNAFLKAAAEFSANVHAFPLHQKGNVFRFIDFVFKGERRFAHTELSRLLSDGANVFYIFSMLLYYLRNLTYDVFETAQKAKISPGTKSSLSKNSALYEKNGIKKMYKVLYDLEKRVKIGEVSQEMFMFLAIEGIMSCRILHQKST